MRRWHEFSSIHTFDFCFGHDYAVGISVIEQFAIAALFPGALLQFRMIVRQFFCLECPRMSLQVINKHRGAANPWNLKSIWRGLMLLVRITNNNHTSADIN